MRPTRLLPTLATTATALLLAGCVPPSVAPPPIIPIEALFSSPGPSDAQISPDGRWLATVRARGGRENVYIMEVGADSGRFVTSDSTRSIGEYRWSADGRHILYLQDNGGDEGYHLHAAPIDSVSTGGVRDLTPFPRVQAELLSVSSRQPDVVVVSMNRRDPQVSDAYRINVLTGDIELAATNPGNVLGYVANDDNQVVVAYAVDSLGQYHLQERASERAPWREVRTYPPEDRITPLRVHPDGRQIYALSNSGTDLLRLVLVNRDTGAETVVDQDPLGAVDIDAALLDPVSAEVAATRYVGDTVRWYPRTDALRSAIAAATAGGHSVTDIGTRDRSGAITVLRVGSPVIPEATMLYDSRRAVLATVAETRPWLRDHKLATTKPIALSSRDGLMLHGYLTLPHGARRPAPMVLAVHGGPWSRDVWGYESETQMLANRGYAVLQINYRGSSGYGKAFSRAAKHEFAGAMHRDLLDAVQWAVAEGYADRSRVAILGGSYGGYATLVGLAFTPSVFACGVDYAGPSNLVTLMEAFPPSWQPFLPRTWYPMVGNPSVPSDRADLLARSPLLRADSIRAPLLIFQGANDPRVTQAQSDAIAINLHRRGSPVTYLLAANEGHSFGNRETSLAVNRATELFLGACLGGRVQDTVSAGIADVLRAMTVNLDSLVAAQPGGSR